MAEEPIRFVATDLSYEPLPEGVIRAEECLAWVERYAAVPFNGLALQSALDKTHSPLAVMASLAWHARVALASPEAR